ncbi:ABC transporter permease [Metallumcola ferriviriculae]|uniref:ABC transporter permease n=1 Tax=Metallumcola ferriviriculae TaxID=3039180 RepID=A0AAU0UL23_9FIRM|nr:ABC transporter permease [Desulfitibacteraceae bacterium MK1]
MNFKMAVKLAVKGIVGNKMRTFLTMLGIIIGVSAVIILVSVVQGTTASVTENIESMGTNLLTVTIRGRGAEDALTYDEALTLADKEGVEGVAPVASGNVTAKFGTTTMDVPLEGVDENYQTVRNHTVQSGRFIMPLDVEFRQKVVLLGTEVVTELFGTSNPLGQTVQLNGTNFEVVGVLEEKGSSMGGSSDDKILMPLTTAQRFLKSTGIRSLYIQAESPDMVNAASAQVEQYLLKKFENDEDAYRVFNQTEMLSTVNQITTSMALMLGGIAAISLLVGGIGIMNIMLVTVTERTREIGIRKAIGARRRDILTQFLIESAVISGIGGIVGIIVGLAGNKLLTAAVGLNAQASLFIILLSLSFSLLVGMFFGIYPANKASKLRPVDALRFE